MCNSINCILTALRRPLRVTVESVVDVEIVNEFWILADHSFGKVSVDVGRFEQADVQRRLTNVTSLIQTPANHLTCMQPVSDD